VAKKRGPGRPKLEVARSVSLLIRVTPDERRAWRQAATREHKTLSEWVRQKCNCEGETR
jgi:uncharacterized protein (DUF1778 family)